MNTLIAKKATVYSLIIGAILALFGSFNFLMGLVSFALAVFVAPVVIFILQKRNEIGFLDNQQGAAIGALSGFFATVSFFIIFTPITLFLNWLAPIIGSKIKFISTYHYSYGLTSLIRPDTLWVFGLIVIVIGILIALTNSATGMGSTFLLSQFNKKPEDLEEIDIKIE